MKKKVTLLTFFVLLFSSLGMLKAQPPAELTKDQLQALLGALEQQGFYSGGEATGEKESSSAGLQAQALVGALVTAGRAVESEKAPLGRLLTGEAHRDVRPLIIEYVAAAPTFTEAVRDIAGLAWTNKALKDVAMEELKKRIEQGAIANQKSVKSYATDLLLELAGSRKAISRRGALIAFELLKSAGADVNAKNKDYKTPLILAAETGNQAIAALLIKSGAKVNEVMRRLPSKKPEGMGIMQWNAMLLREASLFGEGPSEDTALIVAARNGHIDIVKMLLTAGADKEAENLSGQTAFDVATDPEIKKLVEYEE